MNKKEKILKRWFPECPKNLIKDFNLAWIDKSIIELEQILKKTKKLNKKEILTLYLFINCLEYVEFIEKFFKSPILRIGIYNIRRDNEGVEIYKGLVCIRDLRDYCILFRSIIQLIKRAGITGNIENLNLECERIKYDRKI